MLRKFSDFTHRNYHKSNTHMIFYNGITHLQAQSRHIQTTFLSYIRVILVILPSSRDRVGVQNITFFWNRTDRRATCYIKKEGQNTCCLWRRYDTKLWALFIVNVALTGRKKQICKNLDQSHPSGSELSCFNSFGIQVGRKHSRVLVERAKIASSSPNTTRNNKTRRGTVNMLLTLTTCVYMVLLLKLVGNKLIQCLRK